ncbi:MAG: hypothetical protein AABZ39_20920 [Spirochaetota bacterium]
MKAFIIALAAAAVAFAQVPAKARIDVYGKDTKVEYKDIKALGDGSAAIHGWDKVNGKYNLYSDLTLKTGEWVQTGISFIPLADGIVNLQLKGPYHKPEGEKSNLPVYVIYDDVTVEGATGMGNPGFETLAENGKLTAWWMPDPANDGMDMTLITDAALVKTGSRSVRVWHNKGVSQNITVKANVPVTIKVWIYFQAQ